MPAFFLDPGCVTTCTDHAAVPLHFCPPSMILCLHFLWQ